LVTKDFAGKAHETLYKVERFHQFFKGRGTSGQGLLQFYGFRAVRSYKYGEKVPAWNVDGEERKHTVDIGEAHIKK
jgi:hypothetical protein